MNCSTHNQLPAVRECSSCGKSLCQNCLNVIEDKGQKEYSCMHCGGKAIAPFDVLSKHDYKDKRSFIGDAFRTFSYPAKGGGLFALFSAGILFIFAEIMLLYTIQLRFLILYYSRRLIVYTSLATIIAISFIFKYCTTVVQKSSQGRKTPPLWADIELLDFDANLLTIFQAILVTATSFSLPLIYYLFNRQLDSAFFVLLAVSLFYFPMAFLSACYYERLESINPVPILRSIANTFGDYAVVIIIFYFLVATIVASQYLLASMDHQDSSYLFLRILHRFVALYLFIGIMHLIGIFYFHNKEELARQ